MNSTAQVSGSNRVENHNLSIASFRRGYQQEAAKPVALFASADVEIELETPQPLSALAADFKLLDVREATERQSFPVFADAVVPYSSFELSQVIFPPEAPVLVLCAKGQRGRAVAQKLRQAGWHSAYSLRGGLQNWQQKHAA